MLLVILGAGASYDSLPPEVVEGLRPEIITDFQPPLAQGLFEARPSFGKALARYPQCAALVQRLRKAVQSGISIEQELERCQEQAHRYPPLLRQLVALRFYFQEILWVCSNTWQDQSNGITNYVELLHRLDQWRYAFDEQLCFVTFNYDILLDEAAIGTLGADLGSVEAYASDTRYRFLKPHGSVNWGRRVRSPGGTHYSKADHARRILIDSVQDLQITDDFVIRTPDDPASDSSPYASIVLPAITIPVAMKSDFECPQSHLDAMTNSIRSTYRILVIGWRGMERHFLSQLKGLPGMAPAVSIVGDSDEGTLQTGSNLASVGLSEQKMHRFTDGFARYLETNLLEEFLSADVAAWHG